MSKPTINTPTFFIVGAPKCGTTAMAEYLRSHNNIHICDPKEPNFFVDDMPEIKYVANEHDYIKLFNHKSVPQKKIYGEASIWYLYSNSAIENIYKYNRNAKLIVMLRKPADMIYSLHSQLLQTLNEDQRDFEKAWKLEADRKKGLYIPKHCKNKKLLYYSDIGQYSKQILRIYKYFPSSKVHIILFDDFVNDTKNEYKKLLNYLEMSYDGKEYFPKINENSIYKNKKIAEFVNRPPKLIENIALLTRKITNKNKLGIRRYINILNEAKIKRPPLENHFYNKLNKFFDDDITKLSALIEKDLSHWKKM